VSTQKTDRSGAAFSLESTVRIGPTETRAICLPRTGGGVVWPKSLPGCQRGSCSGWYLLAFQGSLAGGSAAWGATVAGLRVALEIAAGALIVGITGKARRDGSQAGH
jgi:hypothetical protein